MLIRNINFDDQEYIHRKLPRVIRPLPLRNCVEKGSSNFTIDALLSVSIVLDFNDYGLIYGHHLGFQVIYFVITR